MVDSSHHTATHALIDEVAAFARGAARPDLVDTLERLAVGLRGGPSTVTVVGGHQSGKTSLVAALVGASVSPVGPMHSTAVATVFTTGPTVGVDLGDGPAPIELELLGERLAAVEPPGLPIVFLPSPLLDTGLVLVDTPGTPGWTGGNVAAQVARLPVTDATLVVTTATQPLSSDEVELVAQLARTGQPVLVVMTRADLTPALPRILQANTDTLLARGVEVTLCPVSVPVRWLALELERDDLDAESGFERLVDWLLDEVVSAAHRIRHERAVTETAHAIESLRSALEHGLATLTEADDPERLNRLATAVKQAQRDAARWNQDLTDQLGDLRTACEQDIRQRARTVLGELDEQLADVDPAEDWDRLRGWVDERLAGAMTDHLTWRQDRLDRVIEASADEISELFERLEVTAPSAANPGAFAASAPRRVALRTSLYGSLRSSYGGMAMFGFLGSMAGLVLSLPISLGIGLALGGKSLYEERKKALTQRRTAARAQISAHVEATFGVFGNDARTQLVGLQRSVRGELGSLVERIVADRTATYEAARAGAVADRQQRTERIAAVRASLAQLDDLTERLKNIEMIEVPT